MGNISKLHNEKQRRAKTKKIIDAARSVFCAKGFLAVTMQDIIDECGISRGGIYLYFASVDEIFLEVMKQRNKERSSVISKAVNDYEPFEHVLFDYFFQQKKRLSNFKNSLFRTYCEYIFSKPKAAVEAFRDIQFEQVRKSIISILTLGVRQDVIREENIEQLADHFIVTIDGLSLLAVSEALTEEIIENQFLILYEMVNKLKKDEKK